MTAPPLELCWKLLRSRGYAPLPTVLLDADQSLAFLGRHLLEQGGYGDFPRFVHCLGAHAAGEVSPSVASACGHLRKVQDFPASSRRGPIQALTGIHLRGDVDDLTGSKIGSVRNCEDSHIAVVVLDGSAAGAFLGSLGGRFF